MSSSSLAIPAITFIATGSLASWWLYTRHLPRAQTRAGIRALTQLHWRELTRLVIRWLGSEGHVVAREHETGQGQRALFELQRDGLRSLLSIKHGAAAVLPASAVTELSANMKLRGLDHGHLVTPGQFAADTLALARREGIEAMDADSLWRKLAPLLEPAQRQAIVQPARQRARLGLLVAWVAALGLALAVSALSPVPSPVDDARPATPAISADGMQVTAPITPEPELESEHEAVSTDPAQLQVRRENVLRAASALPMVASAGWSSHSTLFIQLNDLQSDAMAALCPLLEEHPELAASRIQLQPPSGSAQVVRFRQCRPY